MGNNPLSWVDPFGLAKVKPWWCTWCGAPHGGVAGEYCPDCDKKSKDPNGGVPPNPSAPTPEPAPPQAPTPDNDSDSTSNSCPNNDCQKKVIGTITWRDKVYLVVMTCVGAISYVLATF